MAGFTLLALLGVVAGAGPYLTRWRWTGVDVTAFGANIMDLPPDYSTTAHDETGSGQQELYVALRGSGSVDVDGASLPLDADHLVRVDAETGRVLSSGPDGLRVLCIGGVPGGVYEPPEWSSTGE